MFHHDDMGGHQIPIKYDKSSQFVNQFDSIEEYATTTSQRERQHSEHVRLDERSATIRSTVPDLYYLTVPKADSINTETNSNNEFNIQYDLYDVGPVCTQTSCIGGGNGNGAIRSITQPSSYSNYQH